PCLATSCAPRRGEHGSGSSSDARRRAWPHGSGRFWSRWRWASTSNPPHPHLPPGRASTPRALRLRTPEGFFRGGFGQPDRINTVDALVTKATRMESADAARMWSAVDRPQPAGDSAAPDEPGIFDNAARQGGGAEGEARERPQMSRSRDYCAADDVELLSWSAGGDRRAFDEIVARHGAFALRVALRVVRNRLMAEDLVQEAMVRAWSQAKNFDPRRARFTTWLYRIVMNLCIDQGRRVQPVPLPADFNPVDPAASAAEMIEASQRNALLASAVSELPVSQRTALTLVYDEGMSGAEAARLLGLSAKAVERLLARARAYLRGRLERGYSKESRQC